MILARIIVSLAFLVSSFAIAADWPKTPIRMIVPHGPGSPPDIVSRLIALEMSKSLGQTVYVDNRVGAAGIVGLNDLMRQPADGYTIYCFSMTLVTAPQFIASVNPNFLNDIEPVGQTNWTHSVLVTSNQFPAKNLRELIELAKSDKSGLIYGSGGFGSPAHLLAELLKNQFNLSINHVPYAQFNHVIPDLINGRVDFMFMSANVAIPYIQSGKLKALGVVSRDRLAAIPQVPSLFEQGFQNFEARSWEGIVVKAGVPRNIVIRLNYEINKALDSPNLKQRFVDLGMIPAKSTPDAFKDLIKADSLRWNALIEKSNFGKPTL
jgi:tripartite-type tricarboxylate transporter receptor subunit TctC